MSRSSELDRRRTSQALLKAIPNLSPAELKVCMLLLEQKTTREIAEQLGVSTRTIENQRYSIRRKLGGTDNLVVGLMKIRGY